VQSVKNAIVGTAMVFVITLPAFTQQQAEPECAQTSGMRIYSNATYVEEAGDVVGIEIAFTVRQDNSVNALLYDYEGEPTENGVPLPGRAAGTSLAIDGIWSHHLKNSSGREVVHIVPVKLRGTFDETNFVGSVQINGGSVESIRLHRADAIWLCRANNKPIHAEPR
jgi:hypothetical protein